jgi:hypothetical protein
VEISLKDDVTVTLLLGVFFLEFAAKSLYRSIFKKRRILGFGVFIVIWSMSCGIRFAFTCSYSEIAGGLAEF